MDLGRLNKNDVDFQTMDPGFGLQRDAIDHRVLLSRISSSISVYLC